MKKKILTWELVGSVVIFLAGSLFHYIFEWSGAWRPVALMGAVNESTWEHLKLAFWPALIFALVEYGVLRHMLHNFWIGKFLGLLTMPMVISVLYYAYAAVWPKSNLAYNLAIFFLAALIGQWISFRFLFRDPNTHNYGIPASTIMTQ